MPNLQQFLYYELFNIGHIFSPGYKSVGFLAFVSADLSVSMDSYIVFDGESYDNGNNYDQSTGVFQAPYSGNYCKEIFLSKINIYSTLNSPCFAWHPYGESELFKVV